MKKLAILGALLCMSLAAPAATVNMQFVGFHSPGWWAGYPYYAVINGGPAVAVMCDDWEHGGLPGDTWQANVTDLGTGNLTYLRFNQLPGALTLYQEAGWLLMQTQVTPSTQWTDINYAVWYIFDPNAPLNPNAQYWLTQAQNEAQIGFPGTDFHQVLIYTPVNQYDQNLEGPQEFLRLTPEPTTLALIASGLLGLAARKKLR